MKNKKLKHGFIFDSNNKTEFLQILNKDGGIGENPRLMELVETEASPGCCPQLL